MYIKYIYREFSLVNLYKKRGLKYFLRNIRYKTYNNYNIPLTSFFLVNLQRTFIMNLLLNNDCNSSERPYETH